jgi:hypothetical protein
MYKISTNFHQFSFFHFELQKGTRNTRKNSSVQERDTIKKNSYARAISINRAGDEFVCACRTCDEIRNQKNVRKEKEKKNLNLLPLFFQQMQFI